MSGRIDVHQHIIPAFYTDYLQSVGVTAAGLATPAYGEDLALAAMDRCRVETGIVSLSMPGVHFGDDAAARDMARRVNEFAADLSERRPERFGFFGVLTLPDVDGALAEAGYVLDELGAEGVILLANNAGSYLGDPRFDPLFAELNRRRAVVFVHPSQLPGPAADGIPPYIADFLLDTTRTVVSMVRAGVVHRYPDITFILSHGGGFVPFAAERLAMTMTFDSDRTFEEFMADLRTFHVDIAQTVSPTSLPSIEAFFGADRILFGTDWPHASDPGVAHFTANYDALPLDAAARSAIDAGNARRLLPRYARRTSPV